MVLPNFKENLEKYAKLLVANGINVQPGHTVALSIDVEQAELAHLLVKEAYALGAAEVIVQWSDDIINRERFLHADMDRIEEVPAYKKAEMEYLLAKKASRLGVRSSDPGALNGVAPERLSAHAKATGVAFKPMQVATQSNKVSWTVAAAAGKEWAKKVFPDASSDEEAVDLLWDQIFKTCRVYEEEGCLKITFGSLQVPSMRKVKAFFLICQQKKSLRHQIFVVQMAMSQVQSL